MTTVIERFPEDLMVALGVEAIEPCVGISRVPACEAVFVAGDYYGAGWWLCCPGEIDEKAAFRKRPPWVWRRSLV